VCRIGAIKSKKYIHPSKALLLMRSQQKGHDNSGFAMIMQDLGGIFESYKDLPVLSMACTNVGTKIAEDILHSIGFVRIMQWAPEVNPSEKLNIVPMPNYVFEVFQYPKSYKYAPNYEKEELLVDTRLKIREELEKVEAGYVYSFWPDVVTLKEIGDPKDIGTYFGSGKRMKNLQQDLSLHNAGRIQIMTLSDMRLIRSFCKAIPHLQMAKIHFTKRINYSSKVFIKGI